MRAVLIAVVLVGGAALFALHLYRDGDLQFNRPPSDRYTVTGIDVSHHQGEIDWTKVASSGEKFAFIKATEGGDFADSRFADNWSGATAAGIAAGPYHFFTFCTAGAEQAQHFLRTAPPSHESLPPVVDVEFVGNCTSWSDPQAVRAELTTFLEWVERAWEIKPVLYVTAEAFDRIIADEFHGYPIWIRSVFSEPPLEAYRGWRIWQFSENSRIPGIIGPVDRNALRPGTSLRELRVPAARQGAASLLGVVGRGTVAQHQSVSG